MSPSDAPAPTTPSNSRKDNDEGVMASASLEVVSVHHSSPQGPAVYTIVYTRGGWIWRTSHRYSEWLELKNSLKAEFGTHNLPDEERFPKKEDLGAMWNKLFNSCHGCRQERDAASGVLEERRHGLQAYFSDILMNHRDIWDGSDDIKRFFFPGHPTGYSAALARRRTDELQENKTKKPASSRLSLGASFRSKFSNIFENTPSPVAPPTPASNNGDLEPSSACRSSSVLSRLSANMSMPPLQNILFDTPTSTSSSRHGTDGRHRMKGSSQHSINSGYARANSLFFNKAASESGTTDPDGISDAGGSKHSTWE